MNTMCICQPGFLNASGTCSTCPTGATSTDGNFSSSTAGFWSNSKMFLPCQLGTGSCAGNVACLATFTGEAVRFVQAWQCTARELMHRLHGINLVSADAVRPDSMLCYGRAFLRDQIFDILEMLGLREAVRGWILQAQIQRACDCKTFAHSGPSSRS